MKEESILTIVLISHSSKLSIIIMLLNKHVRNYDYYSPIKGTKTSELLN